ncbi:MAG: LysM peptidoglycan-binding domain-containing protein [Synergistaceae bacterium]|jgi:hypothetical protein|nr:LysM peptidoglycan-binding domain-containing protein [Synergistaceae bacterium]
MKIDYRSRYQFCALYSGEGGAYWGTRPLVKIPESENDVFHRVTQADERRIDLLAHRYYKDVRLWWIIAEANNIVNPMVLKAGKVLRIPSIDTIQLRVLG